MSDQGAPAPPKKNSAKTGCAAVFAIAASLFLLRSCTRDTPRMVQNAPPGRATPEPEPQGPLLEVQSWHWSESGSGGYIYTEGEVKNISDRSLPRVQIVVTFRTKDGEFITSDNAYLEYTPLLPGQTSPFKAMTRRNPAMKRAGIEFKMGNSPIEWREKPKPAPKAQKKKPA